MAGIAGANAFKGHDEGFGAAGTPDHCKLACSQLLQWRPCVRRTLPNDARWLGSRRRSGLPGTFPFTRGIQPTMYRGRLWTMRQYAGFGTAAESNRRYRYLLEPGRHRAQRRLRPADADGLRLRPPARARRSRAGRRRHRLARGHGGAVRRHPARPRVDVDDDQRDGDHPARALRRRGTAAGRAASGACPARCRTTSSRSTSRAAPTSIRRAPSLRIVTDIFAFCERELPQLEHDLDQRLSHPRGRLDGGAGGRASRSRTRIAYVQAALDAGLDVNAFGQRLSFFFNAHNDFLEEIAKFRAARRLWARLMRDRFGATNPRAQQLRFHTQTAGSTLTAQQPDNNIVRVALQALAAVLGGTQSLHCNGRDEALALPTEESARSRCGRSRSSRPRPASRTPSIRSAAPTCIEELTDRIEAEARRAARADRCARRHAGGDRVGPHPARDPGRRLSRAAGDRRRRQRRRRRQPVHRSSDERGDRDAAHRSRRSSAQQIDARARACAQRATARAWRAALDAVDAPRRGASDNLVPPVIAAVEAHATVGEISDAMRGVFGEHKEIDTCDGRPWPLLLASSA